MSNSHNTNQAMQTAKGEKQSIVLLRCEVYEQWYEWQYTLKGAIVAVTSGCHQQLSNWT